MVSESGETGAISATIGTPDTEAPKPILGKAVAGDLPPTVEQPGGMRARTDYSAGDPDRP